MSLGGTADYRLTEDQIVAAGRHIFLQRMRRPSSLLVWLAVVLAFITAILLQSDTTLTWVTGAFAIALPLLWLVNYFHTVPRQCKMHFNQAVTLREGVTAAWDESAISLTGERAKIRLVWNELHCWSQTTELILLFQSDFFYHLLPKAQLPAGQGDEIVGALKRLGVKSC